MCIVTKKNMAFLTCIRCKLHFENAQPQKVQDSLQCLEKPLKTWLYTNNSDSDNVLYEAQQSNVKGIIFRICFYFLFFTPGDDSSFGSIGVFGFRQTGVFPRGRVISELHGPNTKRPHVGQRAVDVLFAVGFRSLKGHAESLPHRPVASLCSAHAFFKHTLRNVRK